MTSRRPLVLIVDDDPAIRNLLAQHLGLSFECRVAGDAAEAFELLSQRAYNLVLSDITMPGESGLDLCREIRKNWPGVEIIMVSANFEIDCAIEAMRLGASDYVTKPFELARVTEAVTRVLRHQRVALAKQEKEQALHEEVRRKAADLGSAIQKLDAMMESVYQTYRSAIQGLAKTLETRDFETKGHSDRVVAYSLRIGRELGLAGADTIALEQGALLHDIGKIGVRDSILLKRGPLTAEEWKLMREHVTYGLRIIDQIDFLASAKFVVGQHHEKYDGSGYPNGLSGSDIHITARIFSVADGYDAITSDRPYRLGKPHEAASREINIYSGSQFDPEVVRAFQRISAEELASIRLEATSADARETSKAEIRSFVTTLGCSAELAWKLDALCA